jgi:hypothetical protein
MCLIASTHAFLLWISLQYIGPPRNETYFVYRIIHRIGIGSAHGQARVQGITHVCDSMEHGRVGGVVGGCGRKVRCRMFGLDA